MWWQLLAYISGAVGVTKLDTTRRAHTDICSIGLSESLFTKTFADTILFIHICPTKYQMNQLTNFYNI